ncbi:MAG TPA: plasmid recombination protein [Ruminiclostridium sp.]|nr:plasmid recombination protein [Ruminiclostridium sp.]
MKRTISFMVGKGSPNHNCRTFIAENVDAVRTCDNIEYCNCNLKELYHEMFDEALRKYNNNQKRSDRKIADYYEKIRASKQEKLFHEVVVQIGNMEDTNARGSDGELAAQILNEYVQEFPSRNPQLRIFSAHLHMDEETPHLHIDFVPFITGSTRDLESRVSLKQALAAQGFKGGTRKETEWNQWAQSEKEQLALVMQLHGIDWDKKETRNEHLTVLNFKKEERFKEVCMLEGQISEKTELLFALAEKEKTLRPTVEETERIQGKLRNLEEKEQFVEENLSRFDADPEWQLPKPTAMMSAKRYREKKAVVFFEKLKSLLRQVIGKYLRLKDKYDDLNNRYWKVKNQNMNLSDQVERYEQENTKLKCVATDYGIVRRILGEERIDHILLTQKQTEQESKHRPISKSLER